MSINFFNEVIDFNLKGKRILKKLIKYIIAGENKKVENVNFIFCSDDYIIGINRTYLKHDYFTDIITFNFNQGNIISGDIFISIDTVKENALTYKVPFDREVQRVIIHGILHLIGFDDTNESLQIEMRKKEDETLDILNSEFFIN